VKTKFILIKNCLIFVVMAVSGPISNNQIRSPAVYRY
jgi:hypothetical protein